MPTGITYSGEAPLVAVVDLGAIRHNVEYIRSLLPEGCRFMAVVKANAYGHGDVAVSKAAIEAGADVLAVAIPDEGARLRMMGFTHPVHLLFEPPPEAAAAVVADGMTCTVYTVPFARALSVAADAAGKRVPVTIEVDTGMRRVGVFPEAAVAFAKKADAMPGIEVDSISTHFPCATTPDDDFTNKEIAQFESVSDAVQEELGRKLTRHAANSAAAIAYPESRLDMARVGIAMYGLPPSDALADENLRPAMSVRGRVALVRRVKAGQGISYGHLQSLERDSSLATIPAGYADGFSRLLTGKAEVLVRGRRHPVVGAICMDLCMVDMGDAEAEAGDEFVIIGQQGSESITADELAGRLGTINYEIVCMVGARVPRIYT